MKTLYVMDPLERLHVDGDSTYVMMRECCDRGYRVSYCTPDQLYVRDGRGGAFATEVMVTGAPPFFEPRGGADAWLDDFDVVWMRKDPPFDMDYILATYILEMTDAMVLNEPGGLKLYNEKVWAMRFEGLQPPTLLSREAARLKAFVKGNPGLSVLKPWDGNGGRGVVITRGADRNLNSLIDLLTAQGTTSVIAQQYIEGADLGDKRILLFDGEPVGAVLRVPGPADYRGNMHVGARVEACGLDSSDVEICRVLGPQLKRTGMVFVGIDVIAGYLTEINVTSPTGIREINRLNGVRLESDLVDVVERRLERRRSE